jgi:hypothetical protein
VFEHRLHQKKAKQLIVAHRIIVLCADRHVDGSATGIVNHSPMIGNLAIDVPEIASCSIESATNVILRHVVPTSANTLSHPSNARVGRIEKDNGDRNLETTLPGFC